MSRSYNIGTECYALITSPSEPEFLLPTKIVLLEKFVVGDRNIYKVKIKDILENDIAYLKEHFGSMKVSTNIKSDNRFVLLRKNEVESVSTVAELVQKLGDKPFYLEDNYITLDKEGLSDLYDRFVKYIINYHFRKLYQLTSRTFLAGKPVFNNQKDVFSRRVERIGFGDIFQKYNMKIDI